MSISRITIIEVVDLPQPDSPTRPTLSPRAISKLMPSTARNMLDSGTGLPAENSLPNEPRSLWRGYSFTRFSTLSSGASPALLVVMGASGGIATPSGNSSRSVTPGRGVARISLRV